MNQSRIPGRLHLRLSKIIQIRLIRLRRSGIPFHSLRMWIYQFTMSRVNASKNLWIHIRSKVLILFNGMAGIRVRRQPQAFILPDSAWKEKKALNRRYKEWYCSSNHIQNSRTGQSKSNLERGNKFK